MQAIIYLKIVEIEAIASKVASIRFSFILKNQDLRLHCLKSLIFRVIHELPQIRDRVSPKNAASTDFN